MKALIHFSLTLFLFCEQTWARAGGAGGGHSGGGGGHSFGGGSHSYGGGGYHGGGTTVYTGNGTGGGMFFTLVVILIFVFVFYNIFFRKSGAGTRSSSFEMPDTQELQGLGDQDPQELKVKVRMAFLTVQNAWSQKRLDLMRRFITDGIYQRFHAQFTMMNILGQSNPMTNVQVNGINIIKTYLEGGYECVDLRIQAVANDQFICEKFPQLNTAGGQEEFVEYWSFIRRADHKNGTGLFASETCPQCSAPITGKLVETARCPYCSSYLNNGEFDWVLAEITQEDDYGRNFSSAFNLPVMTPRPNEQIQNAFPTFSRQVLEDRASNAFMQILIATATRNTKSLQRFTTAEAYAKLTASMPVGPIVYDRLFTNAVDLLTLRVEGMQVQAFIGIRYSAHEILLTHPAEFMDQHEPVSHSAVLVMVREMSSITAKGSVFAGACPSCGAPQKDSLSVVCEYCGGSLNNPKVDWVVADLLDLRQFREKISV
jgi:predicted lipid-binding transport protein (Tim44 family)